MMNLDLQRGSNKGYDAVDGKTGLKFQIKARRLTKYNTSRQLGVIRNLDQNPFDYLVAVIFNERFDPTEIWQIPREIIGLYSRFSKLQNGHILIMTGGILRDERAKRIL